jgi:hypothetical protein
MKLKWIRQEMSMNTFYAESAKYRFIMIAPPRTNVSLWVQPVTSEWGKDPIAERMCRSRHGAQRYAQRFENKPNPRTL